MAKNWNNRPGNYIAYPQSAGLYVSKGGNQTMRVVFEVNTYVPERGEPEPLENVFTRSVYLSLSEALNKKDVRRIEETMARLATLGWNGSLDAPELDTAMEVALYMQKDDAGQESWNISNRQHKPKRAPVEVDADAMQSAKALIARYWKPSVKQAVSAPVAPIAKETPVATAPVAPKPDIELSKQERDSMLSLLTRIDITKLPTDIQTRLYDKNGRGFMFSQISGWRNDKLKLLYDALLKLGLVNNPKVIISADDTPDEPAPF